MGKAGTVSFLHSAPGAPSSCSFQNMCSTCFLRTHRRSLPSLRVFEEGVHWVYFLPLWFSACRGRLQQISHFHLTCTSGHQIWHVRMWWEPHTAGCFLLCIALLDHLSPSLREVLRTQL